MGEIPGIFRRGPDIPRGRYPSNSPCRRDFLAEPAPNALRERRAGLGLQLGRPTPRRACLHLGYAGFRLAMDLAKVWIAARTTRGSENRTGACCARQCGSKLGAHPCGPLSPAHATAPSLSGHHLLPGPPSFHSRSHTLAIDGPAWTTCRPTQQRDTGSAGPRWRTASHWRVSQLSCQGEGTPAPWDPHATLVARTSTVRANPMLTVGSSPAGESLL